MNHRSIVSSALASVLAMGVLTSVQAADQTSGKEKCYGVATAGKNDCANIAGTHSCAGQSKEDKAAGDWNYVAKGSCEKMGGMTLDEAKKKLEMAKK